MININKKQVILAFSIILWAVLVFCFSHQNGIDSTQTSNIFTNFIIKVFNIDEIETIEFISFIIRKLAHFTIYLIGGILTYCFADTFKIKKSTRICCSQLFGTIYSIFDEIHQYFIPERACQFTDIIIDSVGFFAGIWLISLILYYVRNRRKVRK